MFRKPLILFKPDEPAAGGTAVADPPAAAPAAPAEPDAGGRTVMGDLQKERAKRKAVDAELAEVKAKLLTAEQATLSETEQLRAKLAAAEATAAELTAKTLKAAKATLVRAAAKEFHDPEDAVALLESEGILTGIDDAADATAAVKALAKDRPHLVKGPAGTGATPDIQQILENGLGVAGTPAANAAAGTADDGSTWSNAELKAMTRAAMAEAMEKQPEKLSRSLAAGKVAS